MGNAAASLLRHRSFFFILCGFYRHRPSLVRVADDLINTGHTSLRGTAAKGIMDANSRFVALNFSCDHKLSFPQVNSLADSSFVKYKGNYSQ